MPCTRCTMNEIHMEIHFSRGRSRLPSCLALPLVAPPTDSGTHPHHHQQLGPIPASNMLAAAVALTSAWTPHLQQHHHARPVSHIVQIQTGERESREREPVTLLICIVLPMCRASVQQVASAPAGEPPRAATQKCPRRGPKSPCIRLATRVGAYSSIVAARGGAGGGR